MNSTPAPSPACSPLQKAQQFQAVMQRGQVVARSAHFVLHTLRWPAGALTPAATKAQDMLLFDAARKTYLGAIVPKRWARRAVTRNLIKRQIRNVMPIYAPTPGSQMPDSLAVVVRLRASFDAQQFISSSSPMLRAAVRNELNTLLSKPDWARIAALPAPLRKAWQAKTPPLHAAAHHTAAPSGTMPALP